MEILIHQFQLLYLGLELVLISVVLIALFKNFELELLDFRLQLLHLTLLVKLQLLDFLN